MESEKKESYTVPGFVAGGLAAGLKPKGDPDLAMFASLVPAVCAGMFTTNQVTAAPVIYSRQPVQLGRGQAIIANSGNANACTGDQGLADARRMAFETAQALNIPPEMVLVASTGVIGRYLPMDKISAGIKKLRQEIRPEGFPEALQAIMTTDTFPKIENRVLPIGGRMVTILGLAKGAGMIHPQMATMLVFVFTDVCIGITALRKALALAVQQSFHTISVDGDTSTNDTIFVLANGMAHNPTLKPRTPDYEQFCAGLNDILKGLAIKIVKDGEGATKCICLHIEGAGTPAEAEKLARHIARSPLVKTAFFGADPNWGRIMAAIGSSDIRVDPNRINIYFGPVQVVKDGLPAHPTPPKEAVAVLKEKDILVTIELNLGPGVARFYTSDLTYDYVKINASYTT